MGVRRLNYALVPWNLLLRAESCQTQQDAETLVDALNRKINGWANYFCLGPVSQAYRAVEQHTCRRFRQWLCVKHKNQERGNTRIPQKALHQQFGLVWRPARPASSPGAAA